MIPGSERSPGEGIGYPLQHSWASLVAQLVKNMPAMWEIWIISLGWEDPLEKGTATHSSILVCRILESQRVTKSWTRLRNFHFHFQWEFYHLHSLFVVMLPKTHLTSHSRMSHHCGYLGHEDLFLYSSPGYSCHHFLISSASIRSIPFLSFIDLIFA